MGGRENSDQMADNRRRGKLIPSRCSHPDTLPSITRHSERARGEVERRKRGEDI